MGAYISALFKQMTTTKAMDESMSKPININDEITSDLSSKMSDDRSNNLNYSYSPSLSDKSVSLISKYNENENEVNQKLNQNKDDALIVINEEQKSDFVNHGLLHYQSIQKKWTKSNDINNNNENWEPLIMNEEETAELYTSIINETPFQNNIPLETVMEIMNKIWKHEEALGYEINSQNHSNAMLNLDRL